MPHENQQGNFFDPTSLISYEGQAGLTKFLHHGVHGGTEKTEGYIKSNIASQSRI